MSFHLVLSRPADLADQARAAAAGRAPRHAIWELAERLDAPIHQPLGNRTTPFDRLGARLIGRPEHWALARRLASTLEPGDVVYCAGEDVGLPLAALVASRPSRPAIALELHNVGRPRALLTWGLLRPGRAIDLAVLGARLQQRVVQKVLRLQANRVWSTFQHLDTRFFTPGPGQTPGPRPHLFSAGLERRDYRTLAAAVNGLAVEVEVAASSQVASRGSSSLPAGWSRSTATALPWTDLRERYRRADLIVVPLRRTLFHAGVSTLLEAAACRRPLIASRTRGLAPYVDELGILGVRPGDPAALRAAIVASLEAPAEAVARAGQTWERVQGRCDFDRFVAELARRLIGLRPT